MCISKSVVKYDFTFIQVVTWTLQSAHTAAENTFRSFELNAFCINLMAANQGIVSALLIPLLQQPQSHYLQRRLQVPYLLAPKLCRFRHFTSDEISFECFTNNLIANWMVGCASSPSASAIVIKLNNNDFFYYMTKVNQNIIIQFSITWAVERISGNSAVYERMKTARRKKRKKNKSNARKWDGARGCASNAIVNLIYSIVEMR